MSAPPQATTTSPTPKRRKVAPNTLLDLPPTLNLQTGARIQVKWTINDDEDEPENKENVNSPGSSEGKKISVWWTATLQSKTDEVHTLTPEEKDEVDLQADGVSADSVVLPIYELDYEPLPDYGFDERSIEQVAFVSNKTLLNLSSEEIMIYRLEGEESPPSSPVASDTEDDVMDTDHVRHLNAEGISSLMNEIMNRSLLATGIKNKLSSMPMAQQQIFADKVRVAKEKLYAKLMGEMERISEGGGERVINGDVVRRCLSEMGESTSDVHQI